MNLKTLLVASFAALSLFCLQGVSPSSAGTAHEKADQAKERGPERQAPDRKKSIPMPFRVVEDKPSKNGSMDAEEGIAGDRICLRTRSSEGGELPGKGCDDGATAPGPIRRMRHLPSSGLPEQWVPGHPGARPKTAPFAESSLSLLENMSTLTHISDPEDFPYRMNVKLWVQWDGVDTDHDGEDDTFDCSGALLDAKHVITAGHCLWDHEHGGGEADSIVVAPGYDDGDEPYGEASMIRWLTWSGWKDDEDRKHDMAVIELDRPVGALTGDFGYGYRTSCSSFKDYTYYHASYPGESPYDGGDLYFQSGGFDSCPNDYEARFKRYSYGGESGSGFYRIIDDSRYIHAVLSHGDWVLLTGDVTDAVRLTETKFNHIGDFISENTPSSPNLAPLGVQADPLVAKGHTVSPFSFVVYNDGSASSSGLHYQVRLSTNKIISTGDTLLVTVSSTVTIGAKESVTLSPNITIPSTTATGYYYLGVMLTDDDSDESDNTTGSFDVAGVSVF